MSSKKTLTRVFLAALSLIVFLAACTAPANPASPTSSAAPASTTPAEDPAQEPPGIERLATPTPFAAIIPPGDRGPISPIRIPDYRPSFPFDAIYPVYEPIFVNAVDAELHADELVIGVAWGGEAKAYPITVLRFREMVNDELAGLPILVTW
jgi:hypothetical protein